MPSHPPEIDVDDEDVFWVRFADQTRVEHLLVVLGGFAAWFGTYAAWLDLAWGTIQYAGGETASAVAARQEANRVATVACYVWFSLAFMVGRGGPFLNTTLYPMTALVLGPWATGAAIGGRVTVSITEGSPTSGTLVVDALGMFLPGALVGLALVGGFLLVIYFVTGTGPEWGRRHLPEEWHEIELENPEEWE